MSISHKVKIFVVHLLAASFIIGMGIDVTKRSEQNFFEDGELECKDYIIN